MKVTCFRNELFALFFVSACQDEQTYNTIKNKPLMIIQLRKKQFFFLAFLASTFLACEQQQPTQKNTAYTNQHTDTTKEEISQESEKPAFKFTYHIVPLKGNDSNRKAFMATYEGEARNTILSLNRIDAKHLPGIDSLVIPDTIFSDFMAYSPFPLSAGILKDVKKMVVFSYAIQAFAVYESGRLIKWGPTSMGSKSHPTPTGLHFANWKAKTAISTVKSEWILNWNFNIQNKMGVGWHEYALPGYPASHSCLRLLESDAKWLYDWAEQWILKDNQNLLAQGTPTIVFGSYPFGSRRPWRNMAENPDANKITEEMLNKEIEPVLDKIMQAQKQREEVVAARQATNT